MRWHEALLIAVGEVNKDRSPYASKHAIRDVRARRQANLEFLKSCDLENRETGERIDLISKVMGTYTHLDVYKRQRKSSTKRLKSCWESHGCGINVEARILRLT
ncbi:replication A protein [Escherichia coli]|nr:replication A protein [Escherichia coli]